MTNKKLMHVRVDSNKYNKSHMNYLAKELKYQFPDFRWLVTGDDMEINEINPESIEYRDLKLYEHQKLIMDHLNNGKNTIIQTSRQAGLTTVLEEYVKELLLSNDRHVNINYMTLKKDMAERIWDNLRYKLPFLQIGHNRVLYNENTGNNVRILPYYSYLNHGHHYTGKNLSSTEIVDIYDTCFYNQKPEMRKIIDLNEQVKIARAPHIQLVLAQTGRTGPEFRKTLLTGDFFGMPFENKIRLTSSDILLLNDGINDDFCAKHSKAIRDAKEHLNPEVYEKDYFLL